MTPSRAGESPAPLDDDELPCSPDPGSVRPAPGFPDAAADVLARHLSEIGVPRAVHWLYKLPPELRHDPIQVFFGGAPATQVGTTDTYTVDVSAATPDANGGYLVELR